MVPRIRKSFQVINTINNVDIKKYSRIRGHKQFRCTTNKKISQTLIERVKTGEGIFINVGKIKWYQRNVG